MRSDAKTQKIIPGTIIPEKLERIIKTINIHSNTAGVTYCAIKFIDDEVLRKKIEPLANNNINITRAMHLVLFYTWDQISLPWSTELNNKNQSANTNFIHNVQNTYQALHAGLKIAAVENIDACLIEDLHYKEIDKLLQLEEEGLRCVALLALNIGENSK